MQPAAATMTVLGAGSNAAGAASASYVVGITTNPFCNARSPEANATEYAWYVLKKVPCLFTLDIQEPFACWLWMLIRFSSEQDISQCQPILTCQVFRLSYPATNAHGLENRVNALKHVPSGVQSRPS
jgi:hypothetical protein